MNKIQTKDFFTIPNLLGYFRIVLIPLFVHTYLNASTDKDYLISAVIIGISGLTDFLDGFIARKLNQITEFGKIIDPVADKLTQGALVFCLTTRYPFMWLLVVIFVLKEGFMAVMGLSMLKHNGRKLNGAMWFGKVSTAVLYAVMFVLLLFTSLPLWLVNGLIVLCAVVMIIAFLSYIPVFYRMWQEPMKKKDEKK